MSAPDGTHLFKDAAGKRLIDIDGRRRVAGPTISKCDCPHECEFCSGCGVDPECLTLYLDDAVLCVTDCVKFIACGDVFGHLQGTGAPATWSGSLGLVNSGGDFGKCVWTGGWVDTGIRYGVFPYEHDEFHEDCEKTADPTAPDHYAALMIAAQATWFGPDQIEVIVYAALAFFSVASGESLPFPVHFGGTTEIYPPPSGFYYGEGICSYQCFYNGTTTGSCRDEENDFVNETTDVVCINDTIGGPNQVLFTDGTVRLKYGAYPCPPTYP